MSIQIDKQEHERFKSIFENSPIAILDEDVSCFLDLKQQLEKLKVDNPRKYLQQHPKAAEKAFRKIKITDANKAALKVFGARTKKDMCARFGRTFTREDILVLIDEFCTLSSGEKIFEREFRTKGSNGKRYDLWLRVAVPNDFEDSLSRIIVTIQDITDWKKKENYLKRVAREDSLTGLLNHKAISKRFEEEFNRARRFNMPLSCLMIDIDYFKPINDNFGHQVGDKMLKQVALFLRKLLRSTDLIGRYGGDEFLVILSSAEENGALVVANRIRESLHNKKFKLTPKITISNTISIGLSTYPINQAKNAKDFILLADKALYQAKAEGRNCVKVL